MNRPSLLANPIFGLTGDRSGVLELLTLHRHVYFSDLRAVTLAGVPLANRLFYGCWIGPTTFAGARRIDTAIVCCAGTGEAPSHAEARLAIEAGQRGDWDPTWALLEHPDTLSSELAEHLMAVAAVGMTDARMEVRLETMTMLARLLRQHPGLFPADAREPLDAFLLYRAADESDMVYYDAVDLVDELRMSHDVLHHLVLDRARSPDPRERLESIVARGRLRMNVCSVEVPDPPLAQLLDDPDPDVQLAALEFLHQNCRSLSDALDEQLQTPHFLEKLNRHLRSSDPRIRRVALHCASEVGGAVNREALLELLRDPDETLRDLAFETLYIRLPQEAVQDLLLQHEATPRQRRIVRRHEARWRNGEWSFSGVAEPEDLRTMLASEDPRRRRDALILAGFTLDPALIPDTEAALGDPDPRVRAEAERLLPQLRLAQDQADGQESTHQAVPAITDVTPAPDDENAVTITISAGAGGEAANDWVDTLTRMYMRWANAHGHETRAVIPMREPGPPRKLWFTLRGPGVFETLRGETGVHRLIALDPEAKRRFAAFARVLVSRGIHGSPPRPEDKPADEREFRSYVLHPVPGVTDHRTGVVVEDAQAVLDGSLEPFLPSSEPA